MTEYHIVVRVDPAIKELLFRVAKARCERPSDFVRRALLVELAKLSFLDDLSKKALGVDSRRKESTRLARRRVMPEGDHADGPDFTAGKGTSKEPSV